MRLVGALCLAALAGCASAPTAGTGDVAFRLLWEGASDLDLHVIDPMGESLSYRHRSSASGGLLDVDCNAGTGRLCDRPIENVFWPDGAAPEGRYRVWVQAHSIVPSEAPVRARLLVLEGEEVVAERRAGFRENEQRLGPFSVEFRRRSGPAEPVPTDASEEGSSRQYGCRDGFRFELSVGVDEVRVVVAERSHPLEPFHGFGATHASPDGSIRLDWLPDGLALGFDGTLHSGCRLVPR